MKLDDSTPAKLELEEVPQTTGAATTVKKDAPVVETKKEGEQEYEALNDESRPSGIGLGTDNELTKNDTI